ncbi:MAG: HlyD family efflux transporter periplasmic adaptor subunit [Mesorhizobium sp.]|uniref:HlyD family secretion protein n=1 Tax=Mesorhizobium sp. M1D.F.Ca.ET.043.01.1.1 TaxID=2493669 RepID=UPI000F765BE9|nr:HlyD family secretion protein [Mesorhizobium sp. M1D.F.Ca.ET.043.01.1.1]AZO74396.1 HlyD family secretion protein [Mesorhizobium sp. M1D.F.Ca.ET.043.01.1.1]RWA96730.1 MAG: HlyD family efflux transporter periplasmic adaptor subunit [Mesorhizobium sp.]RWE16773.1 MAG: HlyD family efflux transporter periplasmic adaptor subunit [Mesorhizobium sp.]TJW90734.1 MAG: HlyD family efflux transporter periplasmic adaptor subunit [Mesorhizobium sp.]
MNVVVHPASLKADASSPVTLPSEKPSMSLVRRVLFGVAVVAALGVGAGLGWEYWTVWSFEEKTDDAYVQADIVAIAPQVAGYLASVAVSDNQHVKAGDILATIDPRDYQAAVDKAKADVAAAEASIESIEAQLGEQQALIEEANATLNADQATETYAGQNNKRFGTLADTGYGSVQNAEQAASQIAAASAMVAKDKAALDAARAQVGTLNAQLAGARATQQHSKAVQGQAELNLGYTVLRAPADGVVGMRELRVGLYVQPGTQLLAVVPLANIYIIANYEETQLANVKPGQPVRIDVDTFAGTPVRGTVDSIAPASGQEFALLPPDNATGNFTKIVQRIPVRIAIDRTDPLAGRLLPGMSVTTTIDVAQTQRAK